MTPPELAIVVLIYVASLLLGHRAIAVVAPELQEIALVLAPILAVTAAALLYYRREQQRPAASVLVTVGGVLAIATMMVGMFSYVMWQSWFMPIPALGIAAIGTALSPLILFPLVRRAHGEGSLSAEPVNGQHVTMVASLAFLAVAIAFFVPAKGRSNEVLEPKDFAGMRVRIPKWSTSVSNLNFANGDLRLDDPAGFGKYMAIHWSSGAPVQPHEYITAITAGQLDIKARNPVTVNGHEAVTFYLDNDAGNRAVATVWNCPEDRRSMWIFSYLNAPANVMYATHNRVVASMRCHRKVEGSAAASIYPKYVPPANFKRDESAPGMLFTGPAEQNIVMAAAVAGKNDLVAGDVPDEVIINLLKQYASLNELESAPKFNKVTDLLGHERRIWSASGFVSTGEIVQVDVMVWYCDKRNMTFAAAYATHDVHPLQHGIDALLPAACHEVK